MATHRLSVTVPIELREALRALAHARGASISTVIAGAIEHQVRMAALDLALEDADRRHGVVSDAEIAAAESALRKTAKGGRRRRRRHGP